MRTEGRPAKRRASFIALEREFIIILGYFEQGPVDGLFLDVFIGHDDRAVFPLGDSLDREIKLPGYPDQDVYKRQEL